MKTKILFVITGLEVGGAEWILARLLTHLDPSKFEFEVINLKSSGPVQKVIESKGIKVHNLNLKSILSLIPGIFRYRRLVQTYQPHFIQGWMYHACAWIEYFHRGMFPHIPTSWSIHYSLTDTSQDKLSTRALIRLSGRYAKSVNKIVFNSNISMEQHIKIGYPRDNCVLIPNGIDTEIWKKDETKKSIKDELGLFSDYPLIGMIGRLDPAKDHETFIRATRSVIESHPNAQFVLVGPGMTADNKKLMKLINANSESKNFHLLGDRDDIAHVLSGFDLFVLSSRTEAFPNVLLEAMAVGIPCVATQVGEIETVLGSSGFVVPPRQPNLLAQGIKKFLSMTPNEREKWGKRARNRVKSTYPQSRMISDYEILFSRFSKSN